MCWKCDHPGATTEDYLDVLRMTVRDHGWAVQFVEDGKRPYAYTIGLDDHGMPELLVTGLPPNAAARLLNWAGDHCVRGLGLTAGQQFADPAGRQLEVVDVDHPDAHMDFAIELCGPNIAAQQLVWADDRGRWPWERGWSHGRWRQPVLGVRRLAA